MTTTLEPDITTAFLYDLYRDVPHEEWLTLFSLDRASGLQRVWWYQVNDIDALAAHAHGILSRSCVWFGVATRKERTAYGRGSADECAHIPALWVDIDVAGDGHKTKKVLPPDKDAARALIDDYHIGPTHIIDSGYGLQAWWKLPAPMPAHEAARVLNFWGQGWQAIAAERGWHVDNVFDVARIMRLPGTWNTKEVTR